MEGHQLGELKTISLMRVLWSIHLYPPFHNCGSERVAHEINKHLISKGHHVRVILHQAGMHNIKVPNDYEGVEVVGPPSHIDGYVWGDVLLTHLDFTHHTIQMANICERPVINFIHNSYNYPSVENAQKDNYCVYNSEWVKNKLNYKWPGIVFPPPCDFRYYDVCEDPANNEYITLINLDENKGGKILRRLAKAMPDKKFMAVKGSYSEPAAIGQVTDMPKNVTVIPNTPDILNVYRKTRILLMLSRYESWGRTATEAMCNGIPVICTPTPGLMENCGTAGIYIPQRGPISIENGTGKVLFDDGDAYHIEPIIKHIKRLDDTDEYRTQSERSRARSRELDPKKGLDQLEAFIIDSVKQTRAKKTRSITMI